MARKRGKRKLKPVYAIIGDGLTEKIYFDELKRIEEIKNVQIKPELPVGKGDFRETFEKTDELLDQDLDKVYIVIDKDDIVTKNLMNEYIQTLKDKQKEIKSGELVIIECNPCFEIWFLLHYTYTTKRFRRCSGLEKELKNYISDYSKKQDYLKRSKLYSTLKPNLFDTAVPNSKKLFKKAQSNSAGNRFPTCRVHKIISDLKIK